MQSSSSTPPVPPVPSVPTVSRQPTAAASPFARAAQPAPSHAAWLRDCWYVIAWAHEIPPADSPELFHRVALGEPLLIYRLAAAQTGEPGKPGTAGDQMVILEDRCCHRLAPLHKGQREGDCVRCGYHGLKFNPHGVCVEAPGIPIVPEGARVKRYPVAVKNDWVFVWMGDPALADEALLPDNFSNAHPDWQNKPGYMHYDTPYLLICDNLLDFSHLSFVHASTLGGSPMIAQAVPTIEKTRDPQGVQNGIRVTRRVPNVPAPPFYQRFRRFDEMLDRWFIYDFVLPGTLLMQSGGRPVSDPPHDLRRAVQLHSCQTLTPETETSTHYFFQQSHYLRQEGGGGLDEASAAAVTESIFNSLIGAFNEDRDMIRAQHAMIQLNPDAPMLPLAMDSALIQFRRLLATRMKAEAERIQC